MKLSSIKLKGFRNFKDAKIKLRKKTLIIGSNDVGKTNLLWAIRLLLDRGLSDYDIEPRDSDFFAYEPTNEFEIILCFTGVTEDCVVSKLKGKISDADKLYLAYKGYRDSQTSAKTYKLFAGPSIGLLEEIEDRYYRKVLNVKYISSHRDFHNYINREKSYLFQNAKENRTDEQIASDNKLYTEIQGDLKKVDEKIPRLNYISTATDTLNDELSKLSLHHQKQKLTFDANTSNIDDFIKSVSIASKTDDKNILIGGDGRLNQIYLALWASRNQLTEENLSEVTIFCIEEPEAHLHPHQQRKLADYLNSVLKGQVLLTSHSPQIASEFSPNSIVKLKSKSGATWAASGGCSTIIDTAFNDFGYRLSIIPAEAFFADVVLLIEGPSEEKFYKTLAKVHGIDLDKLNISVLMVDGVGFSTFIRILNSLEIRWVLRTDNDVFKISKKNKYRFAGIQRCISYYKAFCETNEAIESVLTEHEENLEWNDSPTPYKINITSAKEIKPALEFCDIFIANKDLENDLINSPLKEDIEEYFSGVSPEKIVEKMQKKKATFMFNFLKDNKEKLTKLNKDAILSPLVACRVIVEAIQE